MGYHYPYFNYGYYGFPRYVFGRKRRDAEAAPEADADAGYHGYYPHYGMEDTMATILDKHYAEIERDAYSGNLHVNARLASSTNQNIKSEQLILHPFGTKVYTHVYLEIKILNFKKNKKKKKKKKKKKVLCVDT